MGLLSIADPTCSQDKDAYTVRYCSSGQAHVGVPVCHTDFMQYLHYAITDLIFTTKLYHVTEFSLYYMYIKDLDD